MRKGIIISGVILLVLISVGCISQTETMYVCATGEKVSDANLCPKITTAPLTTAPPTTFAPTTTKPSQTCREVKTPYQEVEYYTESEPYTVTETYTEKEPYTVQETYIVQEPYQGTETTYKQVAYEDQECSKVNPMIDVDWGNWVSDYYRAINVIVSNTVNQQASLNIRVYFFDKAEYAYSADAYGWTEDEKAVNAASIITKDVYLKPLETKTVAFTSNLKTSDVVTWNELHYTWNPIEKCKSITKYKDVPETQTVTLYRDVTKTRDVTKYRDVTKTRDVTKYRDVTKTRDVTKYRTETVCE